MEYQDTEQKRKIRVVTIATIVAVVVLGLGVWLVVAAISSTKKNGGTVATESSTVESTKSEKTENKTEKTEQQGNPNATSPANQYNANEKTTTSTTTTSTVAVKAPAKEEVPTTGPAEDMMLVALLAGVATYLIGLNFNLKKQAAKRNA